MKAVVFDEPGGPKVLRLAEVDRPILRPGEVLIEVRAAGVNRPDLAQRAGRYPVPSDASPIPGLEVAGVIAEVGQEVTTWRKGDSVMALVHGGGYAEFCAVDHRHVMRVPSGLLMVEAATIPEVALTVEFNMVMRAGLAAGETVLIHGGSSGIGTHAIGRARSLGATPITTSRGSRKSAYCRDAGAEIAIDASTENWPTVVMESMQGRGVDVVLDMVGGHYTGNNLDCLAHDGRYALISLQGGNIATLDLEPVLRRRLAILGSTLRPLSADRKAQIVAKVLRDVLPLVERGFMRPHICATFDLAEAADAHRLMERGDHLGKVAFIMP